MAESLAGSRVKATPAVVAANVLGRIRYGILRAALYLIYIIDGSTDVVLHLHRAKKKLTHIAADLCYDDLFSIIIY
jgi:hypothetical protein